MPSDSSAMAHQDSAFGDIPHHRHHRDQCRQFYRDKVILGPMVRVGTLPMRILALRFGADLVYSEEVIDYKLIKSRRLVNEQLNTIDFVDQSGVVVFRTCEEEKGKIVIQIGTNDSSRALLAARMVQNDVAAIDINMGCPKSFSLKGGMGAALLHHPDKIKNILTTLSLHLELPVSCKIRVLPNLDSTLELVKLIEQSGAGAVAVHGRTKEERPQHPNRTEYIREIANSLTIPVVANGGSSRIECYQDILKFKEQTNSSSVMIARAAMKNCSIFDSLNEKIKDIEVIITQYLKLAVDYDNNAINTKYCIQQMLGSLQEIGKGKELLGCYDLESMCKIYGLHEYYLRTVQRRCSEICSVKTTNDNLLNSDDTEGYIELPVIFDKNIFTNETLPKTVLNRWIVKNDIEKPTYETYQVEKQFHTVARFMNKLYSTPYLEKAKKYSEQSAALVILFALGLCNDSKVSDYCLLLDDCNNKNLASIKHNQNGRTYLIKINK